MKTSELIECAKKCAIRDCSGCSEWNCYNCEKNSCLSCPFNGNELITCRDNLIIALAHKLEGAYIDLHVTEDCQICMNAPECHYEYTRECKGWQWRGNME